MTNVNFAIFVKRYVLLMTLLCVGKCHAGLPKAQEHTPKVSVKEDVANQSDRKGKDTEPVKQLAVESPANEQVKGDSKSKMTPFKTELNRK